MVDFLKEHFEGILAFIFGGGIPFIIWFFSYYKKQIFKEFKLEFEQKYNKLEICIADIKHRVSLIEQKQNFVVNDVKKDFEEIQKDFACLSRDLDELKQIKENLKSTQDLMSFQYQSLQNAFKEIKEFLQNKYDNSI